MLKIHHSRSVDAPKEVVWKIIANTAEYPEWNDFVVACDSSFEVGAAIKMRVNLLPFWQMNQKETIFQHIPEQLLEYGVKLPFGFLSSSRKHILVESTSRTSNYDSLFVLSGFLAPVVKILLGRQLEQGFAKMTDGIVARAQKLSASG